MISEINFVNFVCERGFYASKPVKSKNNYFIKKSIIDGNILYISSFECALGSRPTVWYRMFFEQLGEMVGKLHALSKEYKDVTKGRFNWYENGFIKNVEQYIPNQPLVIMQLDKLVSHIKTLNIDVKWLSEIPLFLKLRFKGNYPARKTISTEFAHQGGPNGLKVQIDGIAYKPN